MTTGLTIQVWASSVSPHSIRYSDPAKVRLHQGELIAVGVVPEGTVLDKPLNLVPPLLGAVATSGSSVN
jgi:hypothetical protein